MQTRACVAIALGLLLATAAAFWRRSLSGDAASGPELVRGWPALLFGLGMALASIAYLVSQVKSRRQPEPLRGRHLLLAIVVHLCAAPAPPFTSTDVRMNLAYGRLANLGLNPYRTPPSALQDTDPYRVGLDWPGTVNSYGPTTVYVSALAARADTATDALVVIKIAILTTTLLCVAAAYFYCRRLPVLDGGSVFFFFACNPLLAWELSGQAHNDALMVLAATGFVWAAHARRGVVAFVLLCLGTATKYGLAPALGLYWLLLWRESRTRFVIATVLGTLIVCVLWAPFFDGLGSFRGLWVAVAPRVEWVVNSPASFVVLLGELLDTPLFSIWSVASSLLMLGIAICYAFRVDTFARVITDSFSFTFLHQLLAMNQYWPWYATWLMPLGLASGNIDLRRMAGVYAATTPALYLTGAAGAVAIGVVHGLGLWMWSRSGPPEGTQV